MINIGIYIKMKARESVVQTLTELAFILKLLVLLVPRYCVHY